MYRVKDMIGKSIVSVSTGEKLGTVSDALLEASGLRLVGLVVSSGMFSGERVLPLNEVQTMGRDAVLARTDEHLLNRREWREADAGALRSSDVRGRRVLTTGGEQIGRVSDFLVEEVTGSSAGLEVESHSLGGLRTHRTVISPSQMPRIGPDAVVVDATAVRDDAALNRDGERDAVLGDENEARRHYPPDSEPRG